MPSLFRQTLVSQPFAPLPIDWDNAICRGLRFSTYNSAQDWAFGPMNYVTQQGPSVPNVAVTPFDSSLGRAPSFVAASSSKAQTAIPTNINGCVRATIAFWLWWNSYANDAAHCLSYEPGDGVSAIGGSFRIAPNDGTGVFSIRIHSSAANAQFATFPRPSAAAWHHYVYTIDMTAGSFPLIAAYVDGIPQTIDGSSSFSGGTTLNDLPLTFMIRPAGNPGSGKISNVNIWSRILDGTELLSIYRNSWQVLRNDAVSVGLPITAAPAVSVNRWFLMQ